jgi:hypothetical protein
MGPRQNRSIAFGLTLLLAGCVAEVPLTMPAGSVPDLRGTWRGTWGGTPLTLLVLAQDDGSPRGGFFVGPWPLAGDPLPGLSGVLTFTVRGEATSVNVHGRMGDSNGRLTLVLDPLTVNGEQITLTYVNPRRLAGTGTSRPTWEPQGPIELARPAGD